MMQLEEEHLFRMLADTRAKLPADSDVLKNEPESIRTALKERFGEAGLQTADGGLTTDQAEEQPSSKDRKRSKLPAQSRQSSNLRKVSLKAYSMIISTVPFTVRVASTFAITALCTACKWQVLTVAFVSTNNASTTIITVLSHTQR